MKMEKRENQYRNPPLQEVIAEFQFWAGRPDPTVPGMMYEKVKGRYPEKKVATTFSIQMDIVEGKIHQEIEPVFYRARFISEDGKAILQVAPDYLSIHRLSPYPSWKVFREEVGESLNAFVDISGLNMYKQISLRYINILDFPPTELEKYLTYYLKIPNFLRKKFQDSAILSSFAFSDRGSLRIHTFSQQGKTFLTFEYFYRNLDEVSLEEVKGMLDEAHDIIKGTFESIITDEARKIFEQEGKI